MRVGVPREIKTNEHRVGLTPTAVREYVAHGHEVRIETGAGLGAGFTDADYRKAGAAIVADAETVFADSDMIVKVKEPQPVEWARLREDHILFTYLHLAPDPEQTKGLLASKCAAIAYETVTDRNGGLPLLAPMSEVAGRIAVFSAAETLLKHNGGMGLLFCGVPGVAPARVLVLGGGVVGLNAARMAMGLGSSRGRRRLGQDGAGGQGQNNAQQRRKLEFRHGHVPADIPSMPPQASDYQRTVTYLSYIFFIPMAGL